MKKLLILAFMGMTSMSFSRGLDFKAGFDTYRSLTSSDMNASQGSGFVLGLDGIAFDSKYVDLGLGLEYNGGLYLNKYETKYDNGKQPTKGYALPIYGLAHFNVYKNKYASIYPFLRLGYAISKLDDKTNLSGVYYGLGLGTNIKNFVFEGLYDGIYGNKVKTFTHKVGIRIGYSLDFDKLRTDAQKTVLAYPKKIKVKDLSNLTDEEKLAIINGIKAANPNAPIKDILVDNEGNVTIVFEDGSKKVIDKSNFIMKSDAQKTVLADPEKVVVADLSNLTDKEKLAVINAIKVANPNAPIKNILVDNMGDALVIFNDGTRALIDKSKTVRNKSYAESVVLLEPERVQVYDLSNLTDEERMMVAKAILNPNANAPIKQIMVDKEGNALIIFNDGSRIIMKKSMTVREKEVEVVKGALPTNCTVDSKMCIIRGFEIDGKEPSLEEQKSLIEIAKVMNEYSKEHSIDVINIIGHTDDTGSEEYNQGLSVIRAKNVADLLRKYGLNESIKFGVVKGEGELKPIDTNRTVNGRYNNRRVVIIFNKLDEK